MEPLRRIVQLPGPPRALGDPWARRLSRPMERGRAAAIRLVRRRAPLISGRGIRAVSSEGTRRRANATRGEGSRGGHGGEGRRRHGEDRERDSSARRERGGVAREVAGLDAHAAVAHMPHGPQHDRGEHEVRGDRGERGTLGVELGDERHAASRTARPGR